MATTSQLHHPVGDWHETEHSHCLDRQIDECQRDDRRDCDERHPNDTCAAQDATPSLGGGATGPPHKRPGQVQRSCDHDDCGTAYHPQGAHALRTLLANAASKAAHYRLERGDAMAREVRPPTSAQFATARAAVAAHLQPTPVVPLHTALGTLWCKLESLQPVGSFKVRGAIAAVSAAVSRRPDVEVVTCSAGNHGLGVAYAAQQLSVPATVVLATSASAVKVAKLKGFAIELVQHGESFAEAQAFALELARTRDAVYISPYNDPDVIAGQSTVATELLDQIPDLAHLLVPVGGGGLLSGIGLALHEQSSTVALLGLQPARYASMVASLLEGRAVDTGHNDTIADGLAGAIEDGSITIGIIQELGIPVVTLEEAQIRAAVRTAAIDHGLVLEGSAAIALAAAELGMVPFDDGPVAMIATGRNLTASLLAELIDAD